MSDVRAAGGFTRRQWLAAAAALPATLRAQGAAGGRRVALVIGNAAYAASPLRNPVNDARAMSARLAALGFDVHTLLDAKKPQMDAAVEALARRAKGGADDGVGLLYYAGHGLQIDWRNYLLGVEASPRSAREVPAQGLDVQQVLDAFRSAGTQINVLVLDACRDNPFAGAAATVAGLAPMDAPPNTYFAYATAPGNVAEDGAAGGNGLFTGFLLQEIGRPGARIEDVFKRVRLQVRRASQGRQIPWESSSLVDDFVFAGAAPVARPVVPVQPGFAQEQAEWRPIAGSTRADDFIDHMLRHPNGAFVELCEARVQQLQPARIVAQPGRDEAAQDPARPRFVVGDEIEYAEFDGGPGGRALGRQGLRVSAVDAGRVDFAALGRGTAPELQCTPWGALLRDAEGAYEPPWVLAPALELRLGARWNGRTLRRRSFGRDELDYDGHVAARETLSVAGRPLPVFRIELRVAQRGQIVQRLTRWVEPGFGLPVQQLVETEYGGGGDYGGAARTERRFLQALVLRRAG